MALAWEKSGRSRSGAAGRADGWVPPYQNVRRKYVTVAEEI